MAETSYAICFSTSIPFSSSSTYSFTCRRFSSQIQRLRSPSPRFTVKASGSAHFPVDDDFGFYPWENPGASESLGHGGEGDIVYFRWADPNWRESRSTPHSKPSVLNVVPLEFPIFDRKKKQGNARTSQRSQRFQESKYMDPSQSLCLGALFDIAATNGLDASRRLCIFGFCRSIEMLCDVVEDTVLEHGGEVVAAEKATKGGLHEKLTMTVAVPLLWGVPPASETLHLAVRSGGGIVDKVYRQWDFL